MNRDLHRFQAHATITPGEHEHTVDATPLQLVRIVLTDAGPVLADDGSERHRPDVVCPLRPREARALGARLLKLADHATTIEPTSR